MTNEDEVQRPATMATCENGHTYPAMAGECPYCLPDEEVQAPDEKGQPRFPSDAPGEAA